MSNFRAIQAQKKHFIHGLCCTDADWPLLLWDQITEQAVIAISLLRAPRIDPTKSAYEQLHGSKYDWNRYPLSPPGTKAVICGFPDNRTYCGPRGLGVWYCGPARKHYRCSNFCIPETRVYRISGSFDLFLQHCMLPEFTQEQHADQVHQELVESISVLNDGNKKCFLARMATSLDNIATNSVPKMTPSRQTSSKTPATDGI